MATVAKIKCGSCNREFDYYFNLRKSGDDFACPYCMAVMERQTAHTLRNIMGSFSDLNMEMRRYAVDRNDTPFQFNLLEVGN